MHSVYSMAESEVITRGESIMLLSFQLFFQAIFPRKAALSNKIHVNILIKHKTLYLVTNKYLK